MTTDKLSDALSDFFRKQQHREECNGDEDKKGLELERAGPAIIRDNLCENANDKQVAAYQQHRDGSVENGSRRIDIDFAEAAPEVPHSQERTTNQQSQRLNF